jgi:cytosine/adenosine deaminase-related metal-dependent hydrolase
MSLLPTLPGLVNAHLHSPYGPQYRGVTRSRPFEAWMGDVMARETRPLTPEEVGACALVTGLENLAAGNTALLDQYFGPPTKEYLYAIAQAYEDLGLRAWVFPSLGDLPSVCYTREGFPRYPQAVPASTLPAEMQAWALPTPHYEDQLSAVAEAVRGWRGKRVRIGVGLSNPVWCSDGLLRDAAQLARELSVPVEVHAEESPVQREVSLAEWGLSGVQRLGHFGLLTGRTLLAHVVQVDEADIALLARSRASVSHNPVSNLKLQVGVAPVGRMVEAGVNVCLGSDGQASGDSQNLFTVLKFVAALAGQNGLRAQAEIVEQAALRMAVENGRRLWFEGDLSRDEIEFDEPLGPYSYAWDDPAGHISEVVVDGVPRLAAARRLVRERGADRRMVELRAALVAPGRLAQAEQWAQLTAIRGSNRENDES